MIPSSSNPFLSKLEAALGDVPRSRRKPSASPPQPETNEALEAVVERIRQRTRQERLHLLDSLMTEGRAVQLNVVPLKDAAAAAAHIQTLVSTLKSGRKNAGQVVAWRHPLLQSLNLDTCLGELGVSVFFTGAAAQKDRSALRKAAGECLAGVTSADFCLADSATLVLKTRPEHPRAVSLVPPVHVAVIELAQVVADLGELRALLACEPVHRSEGLTRCMTFITGPSKTADIEAVMVHGVHGPREVHLYVITGQA